MKKPLPHFCIWEKCWSLLQGKWWRLYCFKKWPKTRKSAACQQPVPREGTDVNTENCSNLPAEPISPSASSQSQENNQKCFPINKEKWERDGTLTDTFWNCWKRRGCATHSPRPKTHMSKMQCGECWRGGGAPSLRYLRLGPNRPEGMACEMNRHGCQNRSHTSSQTMRKFYRNASLGMAYKTSVCLFLE